MADEVEICAHCSRGRVIRRRQEIDFLQWSDRGVLHCHAIVPIGICDACGAKTWDEIAESIVEETIRKEYEQRRKPEIKPQARGDWPGHDK
jgi:hypothetical protein